MVKAVLDTNIIISGLFWRGAPHRCLLAARAELFEMIVSENILDELNTVLVNKFHLSPDEAGQSVDHIKKAASVVNISSHIQAVKDDPKDDKIIEAALDGKADFIVSGDKHLLNMNEFRGIQILKVSQFLKIIIEENS